VMDKAPLSILGIYWMMLHLEMMPHLFGEVMEPSSPMMSHINCIYDNDIMIGC
jgi:hypothetical protein